MLREAHWPTIFAGRYAMMWIDDLTCAASPFSLVSAGNFA
jgi:hypothetical protein